MEHASIHILEIVMLVLGGGAVASRLIPSLREAVIFFQIAMYLTQLFGFYMKKNPKTRVHLQHFVTDVIDHYLKTHPEGQRIAETTDLDERFARFYKREGEVETNYTAKLCEHLGVTVDNK